MNNGEKRRVPIVITGYNSNDFKNKLDSMIKACSTTKELAIEIRKIREDIVQRQQKITENEDLIHKMTEDNMKSKKELTMLQYLDENLVKYLAEQTLEETQ